MDRTTSRVLPWVLSLLPVVAQASGRVGATVLNIGVGARAEAMGGAFVAVADDASALHWNPGAIGQLRASQFTGTHAEWIGDVRYEWLGLVQPIGEWAAVGVGGRFLNGGDVPRTVRTADGYEEQGAFRYSTRHVLFGLGSGQFGRAYFGGALEIVREGLDFSGSPADTDRQESRLTVLHLGGLYRTPLDGLKVGAALRNVGPSVTFGDEPAPLPRSVQVGAAYSRRVESLSPESLPLELGQLEATTPEDVPASLLTLAADALFLREERPAFRIGAEYRFQNGFAFRAGYRSDGQFDLVSRLSGGLGYAAESYQVDYGFVPMGELGNVHRVSFTLLFR